MSQENVEIVKRAFEAGRLRPKPDYDTIKALFHPVIEVREVVAHG